MEAATAKLLWLGSVSMLNHVSINWPSGIWQPSGVIVAAIEEDSVGIDLVTNAFIDAAHRLRLDPIQDTAKEGPAGLIARLERKPAKWSEHFDGMDGDMRAGVEGVADPDASPEVTAAEVQGLTGLERITQTDFSAVGAARISNVGNVRGLIYPSGRAVLSYLYDTPFFNAIDELTQHGNLHVRGKTDQHRLRNLNLAFYASFYQGALSNLINDYRVQNNLNQLLRQMVILWDTSGLNEEKGRGRIGEAITHIEAAAAEGIGYLEGVNAPGIDVPSLTRARSSAYIDAGVGVRYVSVNRYERLIRLAIGVAFWRIASGDMNIGILDSDCAVADAILHSHDMGARLLEISASKGRIGSEVMRIFCRLLDGESLAGESIAFAATTKSGEDALSLLNSLSLITPEGKLDDQFRFVDGKVIASHLTRWNLMPASPAHSTSHAP